MERKFKFYIASSFPRRAFAAELANRLMQRGFVCTARWIHDFESRGYENGVEGMSAGLPEKDEADVRAADFLVILTGDTLTRGGRHTEMGIAIALGKRTFCVGPMEQVFHRHPLVTMAKDEEELCHHLGTMVS
jgi:hypothetical protein